MNDADLSIALRRHSEAVANNQPPQLNACDLATLASAAGELRAIRQRIAALGPRRMADIRRAVLRYGPSNCWTGTTGTLAAMVFELLRAIGEERGT